MILLLIILVLVLVFYYYASKTLKYWTSRGVQQGNPVPLFGHYWENFIGKRNGVEIIQKVYEQSPKARYTGMYRFSSPILMIRDPDLIKQITVKDFESFLDHVKIIPPESDPLWAKNLLTLTGSKWKDTRVHLSPSFTSSKMRSMFLMMTECAENLVQYLLGKSEEIVTAEMRDLFSRYTNDVIATTAFGLKVDSLTYQNNEFYKMGNEVANFSTFWKTLKILLYWCIPGIKNFVNIKLIPDVPGAYFRQIIDNTETVREENGIKRLDMLQLLLEAKKNMKKQKGLDIDNEDITAHALIFFIAGFESVASFICFTTYELALNPEIQDRLREEVRTTLEECNGILTYEALQDMKYMEMVVSESMRKWPHFTSLDRECTKPYTIEPLSAEEKPLHLEKGTPIEIPMYSIQHDSKYFPDPERFDPERFSDENKGNIQPYTYFPFGLGQRNCIGSRFALLEGKLVLFHLLSHFEIVPVEKTAIPLKFSKNTIINLRPEGGFWTGFKRCNV